MKKKIAVVTGANRGIGFEISRQLAKSGFHVVLTSRHTENGKRALRKLESEGLDVSYFHLDVTKEDQIHDLRHHLEHGHGRVDVLINNAGIFPDAKGPGVMKIKISMMEETLKANAFGPLLISRALIPLMKKHHYGRIVNLSSTLGQLDGMGGEYTAYRVSKTALNAITKILAAEVKGTNILINSMCPGWVKTDMGGPNAVRTTEEGADTAVYLATLPDEGPTGQFFQDRRTIPW